MPKLEHDAAASAWTASVTLAEPWICSALWMPGVEVALAVEPHLRRFGNDQACARALRVVLRVQRGRHVARRRGTASGAP